MKETTTNNGTVNANTQNMEVNTMNNTTNNTNATVNEATNTESMEDMDMNTTTSNGAQVNNSTKSMEDMLNDTINDLKNKEVSTKADAEKVAQDADNTVNSIMDKVLGAAQFIGDVLGITAFKNTVIDAYAQASEGYSFLEIADDLYAQAVTTLKTMAAIDPNDKLGKQVQFKAVLEIGHADGGYTEREGHNSIFHMAGNAICYAIKWVGSKVSAFLDSIEFENELLQSVYEHIRGAFQTVSTLAVRLAKWTGSAVLYVGSIMVTAATKIVHFVINAFEWVVSKFTGDDPDPDNDPDEEYEFFDCDDFDEEDCDEEEYEEEEGGDAPSSDISRGEILEEMKKDGCIQLVPHTFKGGEEFYIFHIDKPYCEKAIVEAVKEAFNGDQEYTRFFYDERINEENLGSTVFLFTRGIAQALRNVALVTDKSDGLDKFTESIVDSFENSTDCSLCLSKIDQSNWKTNFTTEALYGLLLNATVNGEYGKLDDFIHSAPQEEETKCKVCDIETADKNAEFKIVYCEEPYAGQWIKMELDDQGYNCTNGYVVLESNTHYDDHTCVFVMSIGVHDIIKGHADKATTGNGYKAGDTHVGIKLHDKLEGSSLFVDKAENKPMDTYKLYRHLAGCFC